MENIRIGTTSTKIPVPTGTALAGFRRQHRICNGADAPELEVNVLYCDSTMNETVVVSVDMVLVNELYRQLVLLNDEFPSDIYIAASHTHYSPSLTPEYSELGEFSSEFSNRLVDLTRSAIREAIENSKLCNGDVTVSDWTMRFAKASKRRRLGFVKKKKFPFFTYEIVMEPKYRKPINFPLTLCAVEKGGSLEAILWTFPCHPTNYYDKCSASSEYIGFVRDQLRQLYGDRLPVLFFQGASGDVKQPFQSRSWATLGFNKSLKAVLSGVRSTYHPASKEEWVAWASSLASEVRSCADVAVNSPKKNMFITISKASLPVSTFLGEHHPVKTAKLIRMQLSDSVEILFINAEVTHDLAEKVLGSSTNASRIKILATCSNECLGYMSTVKEFVEGGYEAKNWPEAFGCSSVTSDQAESLLTRLYMMVNR